MKEGSWNRRTNTNWALRDGKRSLLLLGLLTEESDVSCEESQRFQLDEGRMSVNLAQSKLYQLQRSWQPFLHAFARKKGFATRRGGYKGLFCPKYSIYLQRRDENEVQVAILLRLAESISVLTCHHHELRYQPGHSPLRNVLGHEPLASSMASN